MAKPINPSCKGKLVLISGPSGVGKGTVISALKKQYPQFVYPISETTRQIRPGEKDGEVYHFISKEEFLQAKEAGDFLEVATVHQDNYYGTLKKPIMDALEAGLVVVREVDMQGFLSIKAVIPAENLVSIFLEAENIEELLRRIARRGRLPEEEISRRMESARKELALAPMYDYRVKSLENQIDTCVADVEKIILDEAKKGGLRI